MSQHLHFDQTAEREATEVGAHFMHSHDVVGDMSRTYGADLSPVRIHTDESAARSAAARGVDAFSTGQDVFFARGALNQNDPASRGLLAHELSHSLQQGLGGAPVLAHSAPLGAEQGGVLDWFRGSDKEPEENDDLQNQVPDLSQDHPQRLNRLAQDLADSDKFGFWGNSNYYKAVASSLEVVNQILQLPFSAETQDNLQLLQQAHAAYQNLLEACTAYTNRAPRTSSGKQRRSIVLNIQQLAAKDLLGLGDALTDFCSMTPDDQQNQTWRDVLGKARAVHLSVADYSALNPVTGGQVSEVYRLHSGNASVQGTQGNAVLNGSLFFKEEDHIHVKDASGTLRYRSLYPALEATLKHFPELDKEAKAALAKYVYNTTVNLKGYSRRQMVTDGMSQEFLDVCNYLNSRQSELAVQIDEVLTLSGISGGASGDINTTRRNVATSRMAALLGLDHLVANSKTAEIYDQATGETHRGNVMEGASGKGLNQFSADYLASSNRQPLSAANLTAGFQRDMTNLQVLDVLCGQSDRHFNNTFFQTDDHNNFIGLTGIDNDASFGQNVDVASLYHHDRSDRRVYHPKTGEMTLPYMDDALAQRISALDGEMVRYALQDLLQEGEVSAAVRRLNLMKSAIAKARQQEAATPQAPRRFLRDDEWTQETAEAMLAREEAAQAYTAAQPGWSPRSKNSDPKQLEQFEDLLAYYLTVTTESKPWDSEDGRPLEERLKVSSAAARQKAHELIFKPSGQRTDEESSILTVVSRFALTNKDRRAADVSTANSTYVGRFLSQLKQI